MAEDASLAQMVERKKVVVFHGTRESHAKDILRNGFAPLSVHAQIDAVAAKYEVPADVLKQQLVQNGSWCVGDADRRGVDVVCDEVTAGSWATRAPETTYESLRAVYCVRHPELGDDWRTSDECRLWVLAQQMSDPPVVLRCTTTFGALTWRGSTAADWLLEAGASKLEIAAAVQRVVDAAEWRVEADELAANGYDQVPSRVDRKLMKFMADCTEEKFEDELRSEFWGPPAGYSNDGRPWYSFDDVWSRLPLARQSELELIVGAARGPSNS